MSWFEEPVSWTTSMACGCCATARRRAWRSRPASTATSPPYFRRLLAAGAVDVPAGRRHALRRDHRPPRGRPRSARRTSSRSRRTARPQLHAHAVLRDRAAGPPRVLPRSRPHRATALRRRADPADGALRPDLDRPGLGIELKPRDAERFARMRRRRRAPLRAGAQPAPRPGAAAAVRRHGGRGAAARARRSTSSTTAAPSATSGCGPRSCCRRRWRPPASPGWSPSARRGPWLPAVSALYALNGARASTCTCAACAQARRPARASVQPRDGPAAAGARLAGPGRRDRAARRRVCAGSAEGADFRGADHLPNLRARPAAARPDGCRASAAASRRRCTAATPTTTSSTGAGHGTR